jgi:toxin CcdB
MAEFHVYRLLGDATLVVDCQADLLEDLATRFVAPLLPESEYPQPMTRLTPRFEIAGQKLIMATHLASAVPDKAIGKQFASLVHEQDVVANAIDMLICGF